MRFTKLLLAALSVLLLIGGAFAAKQDDAVFSTDVDVVNIFASVRDKKGRLIKDLSKEDFVLKENGKRQEIKYFARQTNLPLTIGLLVDTSLSQRRVLEQERRASYRFFEQVLAHDEDLAFVISFDADIELQQDLTGSKKQLERALAALRTPEMPQWRPRRYGRHANRQFPGGGYPGQGGRYPGGGGWYPGGSYPGGGNPGGGYPGGGRPRGGPPGGGGPGVGTALYDAVFLAADEVLPEQAGRKALVLLSDGVDMGSRFGPRQAIEAAHRSDAVIYSIYYSDETAYGGGSRGWSLGGRRRGGWGGGQPNGKKALRNLSEQTGGSLYEVSGDLTLDAIYDRIEEELRSQYSLGYTSSNSGAGFREVELKAKGKGLKTYSRSGYYPKAN